MPELASATIELDMRTIVLLLIIAISVATNIVAVWMLRHNLPELHKMADDLREDFHRLDKDKLTRPKIQAMGQRPGEWPKVDPKDHTTDAAGYSAKGTGT